MQMGLKDLDLGSSGGSKVVAGLLRSIADVMDPPTQQGIGGSPMNALPSINVRNSAPAISSGGVPGRITEDYDTWVDDTAGGGGGGGTNRDDFVSVWVDETAALAEPLTRDPFKSVMEAPTPREGVNE